MESYVTTVNSLSPTLEVLLIILHCEFTYSLGAVMVVIVWSFALQVTMQSVPITTEVVSLIYTTLCDKVCQLLATGQWFFPGTPVSSTNNTDRHDIAEILLKVALNTITQNPQIRLKMYPVIYSTMTNTPIKLTIVQLYQVTFNKSMIKSASFWTSMPKLDIIVLTYGNNCPRIELSLHSETISWLRAYQSLLLLLNAIRWSSKY